jgi:hypothetical protein
LFIMPRNKDLKRLARARMAETGERYTQALTHLLSQPELEPLSAAWFMTGSHAPDYEAGLLPKAITYDGSRVMRLRLRVADYEPLGFGALMQRIAATRYLGRRVRFSAMARAVEVTGRAGLWLRVDGPGGELVIDNMEDRPLRGSPSGLRPPSCSTCPRWRPRSTSALCWAAPGRSTLPRCDSKRPPRMLRSRRPRTG